MANQGSAAVATAAGQRAGKYLTFSLGGEEYGLEILKVERSSGSWTSRPCRGRQLL